ncbi:MAG: MlaD family protein [bacterium]
MARRPRWKELVIGLIAVAAVGGGAILILVFGRVGVLHGSKFSLFATAKEARGVIRGTDIWLDGQKVGMVTGISFQPPSASPHERLVMHLSVLSAVRSEIRRDTRVEIRSGGTILGDPVIYLHGGTATAPGLADGDTIHGGQQSDIEAAASEANIAAQEFPAIVANVKLLRAQLEGVNGTMGAFGFDHRSRDIKRALTSTEALLSRASQPNGTVGRALTGRSELMTRAARSMAQFDSIRTLLTSNDRALGRFRRDSTLIHQIGRVRQSMLDVQRLATSPNGTVGNVLNDSAISSGVHRNLAALDSLLADLKRHPLRYIVF